MLELLAEEPSEEEGGVEGEAVSLPDGVDVAVLVSGGPTVNVGTAELRAVAVLDGLAVATGLRVAARLAPAEGLMQSAGLDMLVRADENPGQGMGAVAPAGQYLFFPQGGKGTLLLVPLAQKKPAGHCWQSAADVAPTLKPYVPLLQLVQMPAVR